MASLKVSFRKLDQLEFQCYENALRLHLDSVLLFRERSFPSAFALSVIASEEFGKGFALAEISYQAHLNKGFHEEDKKYLRKLLSDHKIKQGWFASHVFGGLELARQLRQLKKYERIQTEKNNAIYVGVRSGNHQIVRPFLVSRSKALHQVRVVNDSLIDFIEGTLSDDYGFEGVFDDFLRRRGLLRKLKRAAEILR